MKAALLFLICLLAACAAAPQAASDLQTQDVNGIHMEASNFRIDMASLKFDLCYDMPTSEDWLPWNVSVSNGEGTISALEISLIELRQPAVDGFQQVISLTDETTEPDENDGLGWRCDAIKFASAPSFPATITVEAILAQPSEGGVCDPLYLERVNDALDTYDPELQADCFIIEYEGGGGSSGLELTTWPDSMTEAEANSILGDPEFYLDVHGIRGPWQFIVDLE
jgi:hypothetical protein